MEALNPIMEAVVSVELKKQSKEYLIGKVFFFGLVIGFLAGAALTYGVFVWHIY